MSNIVNDKIYTFIKKHNEELTEQTSIDDFANFICEVYASIPTHKTLQEKVDYMQEQLKDDDGTSLFITRNQDQYLSRLLKFASNSKDQDFKDNNNVKQNSKILIIKRASSRSGSEEIEEKSGGLKLILNKKNKKDKKQKKKTLGDIKKDKQTNNNLSNMNQFMSQFIKGLQNTNQEKGSQYDQFMKALNQSANTLNRVQQRKEGSLFLTNLPNEFRSFTEIEQIFKGKGTIQKIILHEKVPCVQLKNSQDAQNLLNNEKFLVYKGIKLWLSSTPHVQRKDKNEEDDELEEQEQEIEKKQKLNDDELVEQIPQINEEQQKSRQDEEQVQSKVVSKEQQKVQSQLEQQRIKNLTLISEKFRITLTLSKRQYREELKKEIEEIKEFLKKKRDEQKEKQSMEELKEDENEIYSILNHIFIIKNLPEEEFKHRTIMQTLSENYKGYGHIQTLQLKLRDKQAILQFQNFESAEKAYLDNGIKFQLEFQQPEIKKFIQENKQ